MSIINEDEILARIHKYKIFRKEGNLFVDVYEGILGKPAHKFVAVPNLIFQEADTKYFGVGDSQKEALKDCLEKIKDVPISTIVPVDRTEPPPLKSRSVTEPEEQPGDSTAFGKISKLFLKGSEKTLKDKSK